MKLFRKRAIAEGAAFDYPMEHVYEMIDRDKKYIMEGE
jgi:hypothetical protein